MARSKTLQQRLFLAPEPTTLQLKWRSQFPSDLPAIAPYSACVEPFIITNGRGESIRPITVAQLHPVLAPDGIDGPHAIDQSLQANCLYTKELLLDTSGSWRSMLATQPPTPKLYFVSRFRVKKTLHSCTCILHRASGVTLGDIFEEIQIHVEHAEANGPYRPPSHADLTGKEDVRRDRRHERFLKALSFEYTRLDIQDYIHCQSPWVKQGRLNTQFLAKKLEDAAARVASGEVTLERKQDEGPEEVEEVWSEREHSGEE